MFYTKAMKRIYTIGHSTRAIDDFIALLTASEITQLVDIRTIPKSRHNPQFGQTELHASLKAANIDYLYLKDLGGLRPATKNSVNDGWHNLSFRNYADYMQTKQFSAGLEELLRISALKTTAIMCAEAVPWRCHRSLVSDALVVRGIKVYEIIGEGNIREHSLTAFAVVDDHAITYPKSYISEGEKPKS